MKVLLVGNYLPDAQQSMLRFGDMLRRGLEARGIGVETVAPRERWRRLARGPSAAKWLGYADKYLGFPRELRRRVATAAPSIVHVVDHSNALYLPKEPTSLPWVATCHDLLAVRGALGEDTDCPASALGRRLQRAILAGLDRAAAIACDSTSTLRDLVRLGRATAQVRQVILLGLNQPLRPLAPAEARARLAGRTGVPWEQPFLLHVGSNLRRKNRAGIVAVLARLRERWPGNAVFCGEGLTEELAAQARAAGVGGRIFGVASPTAPELEAIYSLAHALVFPSKCEGFGWPIVEAQACGCPAICSDRTSLPEIAGDGGLVFPLDDEAGMADAVVRLDDPAWRETVRTRGRENVRRFEADRMIDDYLGWYGRALAGAAHA